jgi:hypothetical protein
MPITTRWYDDDHRVITQKLEGNWTWDELNGELEKMAALAASVSYDLVLFTDMSASTIIPKGNLLTQGRSRATRVPDNVAQIVIVIQSRLVEVFAGLVFEMIPKWRNRVQFVKTVEEGQKRAKEAVATNIARSGAS